MKIVEVTTTGFGKRCRELYKGGSQELKRVAEDHVLPPLQLKMLLHVLADHFLLLVWSLFQLVYDQVRVIFTEVMEENQDPITYRALSIALAMSGADEVSRNVIVVTIFRFVRIVLLECVASNLAHRRVIVFLPLLTTDAFHRSILP